MSLPSGEPVPSREVLLANILRNMGRREMPLKFQVQARVRRMIYQFSDSQYEEFVRRLTRFDPNHIDPDTKKGFLSDLAKHDESGLLVDMARTGLESPELLAEAKKLATEMTDDPK
jgi:hypothetical protein